MTIDVIDDSNRKGKSLSKNSEPVTERDDALPWYV